MQSLHPCLCTLLWRERVLCEDKLRCPYCLQSAYSRRRFSTGGSCDSRGASRAHRRSPRRCAASRLGLDRRLSPVGWPPLRLGVRGRWERPLRHSLGRPSLGTSRRRLGPGRRPLAVDRSQTQQEKRSLRSAFLVCPTST